MRDAAVAVAYGRVSLLMASVVGIPTAVGQILVALDKFHPTGWPFVVSEDKRVEMAAAVWISLLAAVGSAAFIASLL